MFNIKQRAKIYKERIKKRTLNQQMKQQNTNPPPPLTFKGTAYNE
jgi:hypothetical protein